MCSTDAVPGAVLLWVNIDAFVQRTAGVQGSLRGKGALVEKQ